MPRPLVEFREVSKRFGPNPPVLDRISLSVEAGEFVAVIGPSGCGKSTLLRLIAGLTPASGGSLSLGADAMAPRIGFVFQDATLLPWLSVAANLDLPLTLHGVSAETRSARVDSALALVGLRDRAHAFPRQLSGGQKMRVSLARALVMQPELLLLDEPFGALDEMTRERLNEELLAIRQQTGWTAFFVTHSVHEAVFLASRVIVLSANPGRIHADLAIPLPYPRTPEMRFDSGYLDHVANITRLVRGLAPLAA